MGIIHMRYRSGKMSISVRTDSLILKLHESKNIYIKMVNISNYMDMFFTGEFK